jgi:hypothetical protein
MKITITDVKKIINTANEAIEQFKKENPDVDVEAILSEQKALPPGCEQIARNELDKFIAYAKEQGMKMPFEAMEMGILEAGRKDMQNGLSDILNTMSFDKPTCPECDEKMANRGRNKKK